MIWLFIHVSSSQVLRSNKKNKERETLSWILCIVLLFFHTAARKGSERIAKNNFYMKFEAFFILAGIETLVVIKGIPSSSHKVSSFIGNFSFGYLQVVSVDLHSLFDIYHMPQNLADSRLLFLGILNMIGCSFVCWIWDFLIFFSYCSFFSSLSTRC